MNIEQIREFCLKKESVTEEFPFDEETLVFKVAGKIFLLASLDSVPLQINLKCDPEKTIELREMFDIKVYVHADSDERLIRRLKRDIAERGRDMEEVLNRYQNTLKPMHEQFIEPTKAFADIIIPNDKYNTVAIDVVRAVINQRIA